MSPAEKKRLEFIEKQRRSLEEVPFLPSVVEKKKKWLEAVGWYKRRSEGMLQEIFEAEQILAEALGFIDHEGLVGPPGSVVCPCTLWEIAYLAAKAIKDKDIEGEMKFEPRNRRLYVRRVGVNPTKKQKRADGIILPENVEFEKRGNELYQVISKAPDVKMDVEEGDYVLVEDGMVDRDAFKTSDEGKDFVFLTVQENYVKGVVSSWEQDEEKETT